MCFRQVVERIRHFMKEPISVEVKVHRNSTLQFPAVTVCNKNWFNLTRARRLLNAVFPRNNCSDDEMLADDVEADTNCTVANTIGHHLADKGAALGESGPEPAGEGYALDGQDAVLDASAVWRLAAHNFSVLIQECYFGRNVTCDRAGRWTEVVTEMGICQTFQTNEPVKTSGHFNHLYLVLNDKQQKFRGEEGFRVLIHDPADDPRLMVRTHGSSIVQRHGRDVRMVLKEVGLRHRWMVLKEFKAIPSREYFCKDREDKYSHIGCEANCFNRILHSEVGCLLPFMTHTPGLQGAAICNTTKQYRNAILHKQYLLHSGGWNAQDNCTCERKCHEFEYLLFAETGEISDSRARLRVFYQDLYYENVVESLAYPMIPLLCDLGGALGLMLGASLLTFFEIVEAATMYAYQWHRCRQKKKKVRPGRCMLPLVPMSTEEGEAWQVYDY
ncbi:acid-sensing ion channel 3-like [Pollicipes pollicipes]|uniref:acid-sensing ion channel 3-like n=1 Tax=Pollicipes pollicipes TaxID=41117 RepID=UPI0018852F92|nr:acid-sensing ion channel 3-like [Pollicipes pollicipes]